MNSMSRNRAPAQRGRDAISGGNRRIRRRVDLADAARGKHDRPGVHRTDTTASSLPQDVGVTPATAGLSSGPTSAGIRSRTNACSTISIPIRSDCEMSARSISAPVASPPALRSAPLVAALAGQLQLAGEVAIKLRASVDELRHLVGALGDQDTYRLFDAKAGTATKVSSMCCWRVSSLRLRQAIPPCAQCVEPAAPHPW